ncbi:MAG: glycosyltransferase involved in cell wall biosynthesis [Flavobacteriales bacterium]|jgi:glycosyltransferase involved in cell wall biosynthesis
MENSPLISIITPVYNGEAYLPECSASVLAQSHTNFEWIVIDNCSNDRGIDILRRVGDPRIKHVSENRKGVSYARNRGLGIAEGKYICLLDADDRLPVNSLEARCALLEQDESVDCADGSVDIYDAALANKIREHIPQGSGNPIESLLNLDGKCFFGPTWMMRRSILTCGFDVELSHVEDLFYYIQNFKDGNYACTRETVLDYRSGNQSAMANLSGLEKGYAQVKSKIELEDLDERLVSIFASRAKSIMMKSYIKSGKISSASRLATMGFRS